MFYPGNLWVKRLTRLFILCTIGINLFVNDLQERLYLMGWEMIEHAQVISDPAQHIAYGIEHSIMPALGYIENTRMGETIKEYGIPSSEAIQSGIKSTYRMNELLDKHAEHYLNLSTFFKVLNWIFWIPIIFAFIWIYIDTTTKRWASIFNVCVLIFALWFNVKSYYYLMDNFIVP